MIERDVVLNKASKVDQHLKRIKDKRKVDINTFLNDLDCQESILFNMQMAIQNCIDIAAHIVGDEELGVPGSTNEIFYLLEDNGYINYDITEKMVAAVGFRNLVVHEYGKVDLKQVYQFAQEEIEGLKKFVHEALKGCSIL